MLRVTFPARLLTLLQTCRPAEQPCVPSTDSCSSEPAWAPGLWPSAAYEEMMPPLPPRLLRRKYEPCSDCSAPRCDPEPNDRANNAVRGCLFVSTWGKYDPCLLIPEWGAPSENPGLGLSQSLTFAFECAALAPEINKNFYLCLHLMHLYTPGTMLLAYLVFTQLLSVLFLSMELLVQMNDQVL